jgi:putative hydrolase of the HAD superfamily
MPKPYSFILFDFVNTLFLPDESAVPRMVVNGESVISTAPLLCERLAPSLPGVDPLALHRAHREAWRWVESQRGAEDREIPALRRFRHIFLLLGLDPVDDAVVERALELHMEAVTGSFRLPAAHRELLAGLQARYRMGIFSNFDHAPPLRRLLRAAGIEAWFDPVVISGDIGYRKPGAAAFALALDRTRTDPRHVLFVGDSWNDDVTGAQRAGIDVAWVNRKGEPALSEAHPTYVMRDLTELTRVL